MGKSAMRTREPDRGLRICKLLRSALVLIVVALTFACCSHASAANAATAMPGRAALQQTPGRVIVKYSLSEPLAATRAAAAEMGAQVAGRVRTFGLKTTGRFVVVSSDTLSTGDLMRKYSADPAVQYVEPDYVVTVDAAVTPNDTFFSSLWGMSQISAPLAWGTSTGSADVVVADIDTGVDYAHPDLAANMWHNPGEIAGNGIDDDGNGYVDDVYGIDPAYPSSISDPTDHNGHGTHTSGTMAAVGNNGIGVTGVCWTARIMALEFMNSSGSGYTSDAVTCVNYVTSEKVHYGVNVVAANCSWGGSGYSQTRHDAIASAGNAGIAFVCAAGNGGLDGVGDNNDVTPTYPASYDCANIIAVAATDSSDALASFSNWGPASVDLAAPGVGILSTVPSFNNATGYASWSGTSMATPHVTGAIALRAAAYPSESVATRISAIESSVDPVAALVGKVATGGRLDVANALDRPTPLTIAGFTPASGPVGTSVTLTGSGFTGATAVRFHGTAATTESVVSDTQITATVPAGARTGTIAVDAPGGTGTSVAAFTVTLPVPAPPIVPAISLRLSGLKSGAVMLATRVKAKGAVTPTCLAGSKVTLVVQKKRGGKWRKVKSTTRTINAAGAYSWKYKPSKKGSYRIRSSIAGTAAHAAATTKWRAFRVK
ncbi:MAG TPA: S8 family serine peptidase [Thermoleophilia bacterium]|nr:S8 family serine peptidase [Thermoleophilia bacterium]